MVIVHRREHASIVKLTLSAAQAVPSAADTKVLIDTAAIDLLGELDAANNRWVASRSGYYFIKAVADWQLAGVGINMYVRIEWWSPLATVLIAGSSNTAPFTLFQEVSCSCVYYIQAGEGVQIYAYQNTGVNKNLTPGPTGTRIEVIKLK